jgi:hypothetical protein
MVFQILSGETLPNQAQNGYAFEYSIIKSIPDAIRKWISEHKEGECNYRIIEDTALENVRSKFLATPTDVQNRMIIAAKAGVRKILDMEPRLTHATSDDPIVISSKPATAGIQGDVRDIVMIRQINNARRRAVAHREDDQPNWEIGISAKWNNEVIKNSRLAEHLDFCQSWFGFPCTSRYWDEISVPMTLLNSKAGQPWRLLNNKKELVYLPMTEAFINEITLQSNEHPNISELLVEYLLGKFDFYKLMSKSSQRVTNIQAVNLRGNLNQNCNEFHPIIRIASQANQRPTRIVSVNRFRNRPAWVEIILDNGYQFTLRLHNAESNILTSLKFDIQFAGSPFNTWSESWA